jgi:hypothetical protein
MKKIILSLSLVLALFAGASAQSLHIGAKAGANFGKIDGQAFKDGYNFGYVAGGYVDIGFNKNWGIQPELIFSQTNTTTVNSGNVELQTPKDLHLNYMNIPVLLNINASKLLTLQVGPQFSILMNKDQSITENGEAAFKGGDFAAVLGAQLNFGALNVYGRYNIGLSDISDVTNQNKWKSQNIQVGIGFRIL